MSDLQIPLEVPSTVKKTRLDAFRWLHILQLQLCQDVSVVMIQSSNLPHEWVHYSAITMEHLNLDSVVWDVMDLRTGEMHYSPKYTNYPIPFEKES